ncbi:MAG: hypothetical protein ACI9IV_001436 [Paracoccaceae bacterium]|jgi:hypothetical protein
MQRASFVGWQVSDFTHASTAGWQAKLAPPRGWQSVWHGFWADGGLMPNFMSSSSSIPSPARSLAGAFPAHQRQVAHSMRWNSHCMIVAPFTKLASFIIPTAPVMVCFAGHDRGGTDNICPVAIPNDWPWHGSSRPSAASVTLTIAPLSADCFAITCQAMLGRNDKRPLQSRSHPPAWALESHGPGRMGNAQMGRLIEQSSAA